MPIPSLLDLQRWLAWRITGVGTTPHTGIGENWIAEQPPISRDQRLEIYAHAYLSRLVENLEDDFSAVARVLGSDAFRNLIQEYVANFPPASPNVNDLGANFPAFLLLHPIVNDYPFLFELATFEWALVESVHTDSGAPLDPATFQDVPEAVWLQATASVNPSVRLFNFEWPIIEIWHKKNVQEPRRTFVIIFRANDKAHFNSLSENEFRLLRLLERGADLGSALEEAAFTQPEQIRDAFSRWNAWGVFSRFDFGPAGCD